jgi:hypothetical protein
MTGGAPDDVVRLFLLCDQDHRDLLLANGGGEIGLVSVHRFDIDGGPALDSWSLSKANDRARK